MSDKLSTVRKALMWWFHWPGNPYICVTAAVDFRRSQSYLEQLNTGQQPKVSINHLVVAAVTRVLREFPEANAWLLGHSIKRQEHVGVGMPVNLQGHQAGAHQEVGLAVVQRSDTMTLRGVAGACRGTVKAERGGKTANRLIRAVSGVADRLPYGVLARGLGLFHLATRNPLVATLLQQQLGFTTVVTNAGAPFGKLKGAQLRGVAMELPQRLFHLGTVWGISAVQDEVFPVDGVPVVCPALPVVLVFDHRLFDGVKAGQILIRFVEILQDPAAVLGPDGDALLG